MTFVAWGGGMAGGRAPSPGHGIRARRRGFMPPGLLEAQVDALETPR